MVEKSLKEIDLLRYQRKYDELCKINRIAEPEYTKTKFKEYIVYEANLLITLNVKESGGKIEDPDNMLKSEEIKLFAGNDQKLGLPLGVDLSVLLATLFSIKQDESSTSYNTFLKTIENLPSLKETLQQSSFSGIEYQPFRARTILEIYLKKYFNGMFSSESGWITEMNEWFDFFISMKKNIEKDESINAAYSTFVDLDKSLIKLWLSKYLFYVNSSKSLNALKALELILENIEKMQKNNLFSQKFSITILFNVAKLSLTLMNSKTAFGAKLKEGMKSFLSFFNKMNLSLDAINSWEDLILTCICIYESILTNKLSIYTSWEDYREARKSKKKKISKYDEENGMILMESESPQLTSYLLFFACYNYKLHIKLIDDKTQAIVSHKFPSLITIYCEKRRRTIFRDQFYHNFLSMPFDDDIFLMKFCVYLYENKIFNKCYQLTQKALESDFIQNHKFRPILIALCCVLCGKYLGKYEEALEYAKLNLNFFSKTMKKEFPVKQDSLYYHLSYSYQNIANNTYYMVDRLQYYSKALEFYSSSCKLNQENYVVCYNMAKIYGELRDIEKAIQMAKKSSLLNKRHTNSLILLALLYTAEGEMKKAEIIIDELIMEAPEIEILYLIKAYLEADRYWQRIQKEKQDFSEDISEGVGPSDDNEQLGKKSNEEVNDEIKPILNKLILCISSLLNQRVELGTNDQEYFSRLPKLEKFTHESIDARVYLDYKHVIIYSIELCQKLAITKVARYLMDLLGSSKIEKLEKQYYLAVSLSTEKKYEEALKILEEILLIDPQHHKSLVLEATILSNLSDFKNADKSLGLFLTALKHKETAETLFGLGNLYAEKGDFALSNEMLCKALQINMREPILPFNICPDIIVFRNIVPEMQRTA